MEEMGGEGGGGRGEERREHLIPLQHILSHMNAKSLQIIHSQHTYSAVICHDYRPRLTNQGHIFHIGFSVIKKQIKISFVMNAILIIRKKMLLLQDLHDKNNHLM